MAALAPQHIIAPSLPSRGRRPALIPHHSDLSLSLSAASAALSLATYSPGRDASEQTGVWVLPPPRADTTSLSSRRVGDDFAQDLFLWVNSPATDDAEKPLLMSPTTTGVPSGADTVPTSPLSNIEGMERQTRRLEAAGRD